MDGKVVEISGDRGSGKTALALHVVLQHLSTQEDSTALWLDTTGNFVAGRLVRLAAHHSGPASATMLDRVHVSLAFEVETAYEVLGNLHATLSSNSELACGRPHIVVVDTVTALISPLLTAVSSEGHATMVDFMRMLHTLAQVHGLAILVLNDGTNCLPANPMSVFPTTTRKPALGPSFAFLTDATLWLAHPPEDLDLSFIETGILSEQNTELRVAEAFRSRFSTSSTWCLFRLREGLVRGV